MQVTEYILSRDGAKPVGVYALYDSQQQLQYIGLARNMVLAIKVEPPHPNCQQQGLHSWPCLSIASNTLQSL